MADVDLYQNYLSKHHAGAQDPRMYEQAVEIYGHLYRGLLPEDRAAPILDVGAGMGQFLHFLKVNGHGNHLGIDIGDEQVAWCREHVTPNVRKIADLVAFLEEKPDHWALVAMNDVIEHIPREQLVGVVAAARKALAPGGFLVTKTCNGASLAAAAVFHSDLTHHVFFSEVSLRQLFVHAGFAEVGFRACDLPPNGTLARAARHAVLRALHAATRLMYRVEMVTPVPQVLSYNVIAFARR